MKKYPFLLAVAAGAAAIAPAARADVAWNHVGNVTVGGKQVLSFSMQNQWSGSDHRTAFNLDATKLLNTFAPSAGAVARGQVQFIERLGADRLIISSPQLPSYFDEPYKNLKSRLRLNFWEALGSDLSPNNIPELTTEQRQRLGQEIRAVVTPFTKKISRTYFRALPTTRVIGGMNSRGFRYTTMTNASGDSKHPQWVRVAAEWWLAEAQSGDEEIRSFTQQANAAKEGPRTASMWANEYMPVLWEAAPDEVHQALASLIGTAGSTNAGFQGTPMQFFATVSLPAAAEMGMGGDIKFSLELKNRHTNSAAPALFEAPKTGQRVEIEPFLGIARNYIKQGRTQLEKLINGL